MSRLTVESAQEIVKFNREVIYHLPRKYKNLNAYLQGSLKDTLLKVLGFIADKKIIIDQHRYEFFCDNKTLTYRVRRKSYGESTSSRHMNLLCALGLFTKQNQNRNKDKLIEVNRNYFKNNPLNRRAINVYSFRRYNEKELQRIEERAERLARAGVTAGNFCQSMLVAHGLEDLAEEALPANDKTAPDRKMVEQQELMNVLELLVDSQGYATKEQIRNNLILDDKELDKVFRIFRRDIADLYYFKRPTKKQMEDWGLQDLKNIYTRKE